MKKLNDLLLEATDLCDEEYDNAQWMAWFNNGLDDLAEVLFITKKATITASVDGTFLIPDDMKTIIRINSITSNIKPVMIGDDISIGYRIIGNTIEVQGEYPTTIDMLYYKYPTHFVSTNVDAIVDLSDRYTKALVLYACAQGMLREDETERYNLFHDEYLVLKEGIFNMSKTKMPSRSGRIEVVR